jgi:predicted unusual protein kinase regulating ubiquinone biosynthesis (AarF/ABC1/UbiB family)
MEFSWILPEFKSAMAQELNFVHEAQNAEKLKHNFRKEQYVKVPDVSWVCLFSHSSPFLSYL